MPWYDVGDFLAGRKSHRRSEMLSTVDINLVKSTRRREDKKRRHISPWLNGYEASL